MVNIEERNKRDLSEISVSKSQASLPARQDETWVIQCVVKCQGPKHPLSTSAALTQVTACLSAEQTEISI